MHFAFLRKEGSALSSMAPPLAARACSSVSAVPQRVSSSWRIALTSMPSSVYLLSRASSVRLRLPPATKSVCSARRKSTRPGKAA